MTRVRVLLRAIELLKVGFIKMDYHCIARNEKGETICYFHPDARRFTMPGAVMRAIFDLTEQPADERDKLWTETMRGFYEKHGKNWSRTYDWFESLDKKQAIEAYEQQLRDWNAL